MHIAIDASRAANGQRTGVEHYSRQIIEHLIRYVKLAANNPLLPEHEQQRLAAVRFTLYCRERPDAWLQELDTYDFVSVARLQWPVSRLWTQGRMSLEMLRKPPDVLFVPASALPLCAAPLTVAVIHDVGFMAYPERFEPKQRRWLEWSTKRALRTAERVITISEFSKGEIIRYFGREQAANISVTPLGVDTERFAVADARSAYRKLRAAYGIDRPFILFVGRLESKKNITGVIEAFYRFKREYGTEHVLSLVGRPGYGWEAAAEMIARYKLQADVVQPGYVTDGDLPYWYAAADALLFPSYYEGFGLPVIEAMAAGTPVIASDAGSLPEITQAAALLAAPDDHVRLAEHIRTVTADAATRQRLVAAGRKRAADFSWGACAERTFSVLYQR